MKTFQMEGKFDVTLTVPEQFLADMRQAAMADDATPFLKTAQAMHTTDDNAFLLMILSNGLRLAVRNTVIAECRGSGIGVRMAPLSTSNKSTHPNALPVGRASLPNLKDARSIVVGAIYTWNADYFWPKGTAVTRIPMEGDDRVSVAMKPVNSDDEDDWHFVDPSDLL